ANQEWAQLRCLDRRPRAKKPGRAAQGLHSRDAQARRSPPTSPIPTTWRDSRELRRRSDEARPGRLRGLQEPGRVDGACRRTSLESPQTSPTQYLCGGDEGSTARGLIGVGAGGPGPLSPSPFQFFSAVLRKTGAKVVAPKQPATLDHPRL